MFIVDFVDVCVVRLLKKLDVQNLKSATKEGLDVGDEEESSRVSDWASIQVPTRTLIMMRCGWPCWTRFVSLKRTRRIVW